MKSNKSHGIIELVFRSTTNKDLTSISLALGLTPTTIVLKDQSYGEFGISKFSFWKYEFYSGESNENLDESLNETVSLLFSKRNIVKYISEFVDEKILSIIIYKKKNDNVGLDLSNFIIKKLHYLEIELVFNVYDLRYLKTHYPN